MDDKRIKRIKRSIIELSTVWGVICLGFLFWLFEIRHFHFHPDIPVPAYSIAAVCLIIFFNFPALAIVFIVKVVLINLSV